MELSNFDPYQKLPPDLRIFDSASLKEVESLAACLSIEETLDYFGTTEALVKESQSDHKIFIAAWKRGRSKGKFEAASCLFTHMKGRNGANVALAYLRQVATEWPQVSLEANGNKNFSFKVIMDDDE